MDNWQTLGQAANNVIENLKHCSSTAQALLEQCSNVTQATPKHNHNINHNQAGEEYVKNAWN
jgi:hypothetical protein